MEPMDAQNRQQGVDHRVSMLADAVNAGVGAKRAAASGEQGNSASHSNWALLKQRLLAAPKWPRLDQLQGTSVQPNNMPSTSSQSTNTGQESTYMHDLKLTESPWEPFLKDQHETKTVTTSAISTRTVSSGMPPLPPPPPPSYRAFTVAHGSPKVAQYDVQPIQTQLVTGREQKPAEDGQLQIDTSQDDPSMSIGTQTDKRVQIQVVKSKTSKMKTKCLQIDFPDSGNVQQSSIFKRSRSITPTRYKTLKEDQMKNKGNKSVSVDRERKHLKKSSSREKLLTIEKKRMRRGESPSPPRQRRDPSASSHMSRDKTTCSKSRPARKTTAELPNKVLKARVQPQQKEITGRIIVAEQKENTSSPPAAKGRRKKAENEARIKGAKKTTTVKNTSDKSTPMIKRKVKEKPDNKEKSNKKRAVQNGFVKAGDNFDNDEDTLSKSSRYNSTKLEGIAEVEGIADVEVSKKPEKDVKKKEKEKKEKEKKENKEKKKAATHEDGNSLKKSDEKQSLPKRKDENKKIDDDKSNSPDKSDGAEEEEETKVTPNEIQDKDKNDKGDMKEDTEKQVEDLKEITKEDEIEETIEVMEEKIEEEDATAEVKIKPTDFDKLDVESGITMGLVNDLGNVDREVDSDDKDLPPREMDYMEDILAAAGDANIDLDPELVTRTEDQIFAKIKFYKEVLDGVKDKPWTLRKKMTMLKEAREYTAKFEGKLSKSGGPDHVARLRVALTKASRELSNFAALLVPWEGKIKHIESYFGSVVASYFTFLRWIFWTNIMQAVIIGGVIMAPEIIFGPEWGTVEYKSVPDNETEVAAYLKTAWDFEGYVKHSPLFFGYYSSVKSFASGYSMPMAYLIGNIGTFAYSFIAILRQVAANAKDEKASDKDDNFNFSWKAFANWDYMIGNSETAKNKFKSIVIAIRESITEQKEAKKKIGKKLKFLRVLANILVVLVLGGSTYAIYVAVERSREFEQRVKEQGPDSVNSWERNEISVVMSLVTSLFPMLFDIIAGLEDYHPRVALQWSLYRILTLYLLNLYTLYIALYWKIQTIQEEADLANSTYYSQLNLSEVVFCTDESHSSLIITDEMLSNTTTIPYSQNATECLQPFVSETTCWETMVGQELFKLTMFDMVTTIALIYATEFFRAVIVKSLNACWCWDLERNFPGYASFSLAENLLHLVYNQGMIWMGTLFAPGLPIFNLIKLLCMFYVRAWAVMVCNVPEERIFKAGSDNFYLLILLFMLYVVMIPIAFAMVSIRTSKICGPFRNVEFMYLALTDWMDEALGPTVNSVLEYISSPGALIPIFILLFLILNYLKSNNEALKGLVLDLKKQLNYERTEGKKKVFNLAEGESKAKKSEETVQKGSSSITALRALQKMGAFKNQHDSPSAAGQFGQMTGVREQEMVSKKGSSSLTALRALHRMGAFKNANPAPSVQDMAPRDTPSSNKTSLGVALTATQFLAKMKHRANAAAATKAKPMN